MFDFIWRLRGSIALDGGPSDEIALRRLERWLAKQHKRVTERGADFVVFNQPLLSNFLSPNWLALGIYDQGRIWIEQGPNGRSLRYDLRSLQGLIFCLAGAVVIAAFYLLAGGGLRSFRTAALVFAWLYGVNVALAFIRVPGSIRKGVFEP